MEKRKAGVGERVDDQEFSLGYVSLRSFNRLASRDINWTIV